jgi:PAS domain S-box-containing protein
MTRRSLLSRILLLAGLGVAMVSLLQLVVQVQDDLRFSAQRVYAITEEVAASTLPLMRNTLVVGDLATTQETLDNVMRYGHFRRLQLLDADARHVILEGRHTASKSRGDAPAWFAELLAMHYGTHRFPVSVGGTGYGVLLAEPSDALLIEGIWRRAVLAMLLGVVSVIAMWLVLLVTLRRGLAPLEDLAAAARDLGQGDLARRAPVSNVPELAVTAESFNQMAGNVESLVAEVHQRAAENRQLAAIVAQSGEAIITLDLDGQVSLWNAGAVRLLGYSAAEAVGASFAKFLPDTPPGQMTAMLSRIRSHAPRSEEEFKLVTRSGAVIEVALATSPLFDEDHRHIGEIVVGHDVSERNRIGRELSAAKEAAEAANRAKAEFLATMSHEIRTPMNGVIGMTHLVLDTDLNAMQRKYLQLSVASAEALLTILNEILDLSKIEAGKLALEQVDFNLAGLIEEIVHVFATQCQQKGLDLRSEILDGVPQRVVGDPVRLRQVLFNLLGNALKFTEAGGVSLRVDLVPGQADYLRFSVRDSGIGMTAEQRARIFQPFVQADGSTTRRYGGTGLGLTICARLVDMMGGHIEVNSQPGEGSTFQFSARLPAGQAHSDQETDTSVQVRPSHGEGMILLAEDTPVNQLLAVKLLEKRGYRVRVANNGLEATELYGRETIDLILMDVHMPVMDGYEAALLIRELEKTAGNSRHIPIVAVTASVLEEDRRRCAEVGMDGFIGKPINRQELYDTLDRFLRPEAANPSP